MRVLVLFAFLSACTVPEPRCDAGDCGTDTGETGGTGETGETGDTGAHPLGQDDFIDVSEPVEGDLACIGQPPAEPEAVCIAEQTLQATVYDFQTEDGVAEADWFLWESDDPTAAADAAGTADRRGQFTTLAATCTPLTMATTTPEEWESTVPTYVQHLALDWGHIGVTSAALPAVGVSTAKIIPALLGVEWTEGTGLVVGSVVGCDGQPVGMAQVYAHDGAGGAPAAERVFYMDAGLPSTRVTTTSGDDGAFLVMELPPGEWTVSGFAWDGALVELGAAPVTVLADAVTLVTVVVGREDGVDYPDICFAACDQID